MSNWDNYFFEVCEAVGRNSKCLSRQIGSIIVKDKSIISTGYNGPSRGVPHCSERYAIDKKLTKTLWTEKKINVNDESFDPNICPRQHLGFPSGEGLEWCVAGHAERNALINAARHGIAVDECKLYLNTGTPCKDCLIEILNAGIIEIICAKMTYYDMMSLYLLETSGIAIREFEL